MTLYGLFIIITLAALVMLLAPLAKASNLSTKHRSIFILIVSSFFFAGGFGLYHFLGAPDILPLLAEREKKIATIKESILRYSEQAKANPKNLSAWVGLGQNFMETSQYNAAANAFKQAVVLSQGNPHLLLAYAEGLIAEAEGKVTDDAKRALEMGLLQEPMPEIRYWLAVRQLQDGQTTEAMTAMKSLYRSLPADSPLKARIDAQIGKK